ncbi:AzlD domain-containing protein [Epibacterium sp. SM1969]|uniref:AzlD domain-containing protein n=1 Tax=Tritonibacter aquimaris TaxID=2663379 RepID=A0A844AP41_9RHOB|nr:AzlD domain-containing protein [Tritonibacter aquimaris]MQY42373.1 AzlD domain-containing protein [Tritonibacter aquimaris]
MSIEPTILWTVIIGLALGSFALRFVFIGLMGGRSMPDWLMRHLRYTAVAIIPALVAPLVVWPAPTGGEPSAIHLAVGCATLAVGYFTKNVFAAMGTGAVLLVGYLSLFS